MASTSCSSSSIDFVGVPEGQPAAVRGHFSCFILPSWHAAPLGKPRLNGIKDVCTGQDSNFAALYSPPAKRTAM
jgi:hypothetical protein